MIDLIWFLIGMAFLEAILKPTIVYFTQKETRRLKAIADLLIPELMKRTDPFMPDWIQQGSAQLDVQLVGTVIKTAMDKEIKIDSDDYHKIAEQFIKIHSVYENAKTFNK